MASYPSRGRRRRSAPNYDAIAKMQPDELLKQAVRQCRANVAGQPVDGVRPSYSGMPRAQAVDKVRLAAFEREAKRRELEV